MLIDSHCHLDILDPAKYDDVTLPGLIAAAKQAGVEHILCPAVTLGKFPGVLKIAQTFENVTCAVGQHPDEPCTNEPTVEELVTLAQSDKNIVAIGETGLDYYHDATTPELQRERFRRHIRAAKLTNKPLIIHTRDAREDTIKIMREEIGNENSGIKGVMHCFTENWQLAEEALNMGFYISFSGIVTFKKALELKEIAKRVPLDRMLIETDAPYLAPEPKRGKPNQPAYVRYIAEYLADLRGISFEELARQTSENFFALF